jgi:hypothetical protein
MEAWEKKAGVKAGPGDAIVLRWGRYGRRAKLGPDDGAAGFDNWILPWLKQRDIALIIWETAGYSPQPQGDLFRSATHNFVQAILGIHILDRADLEALSQQPLGVHLDGDAAGSAECDRVAGQSDCHVLTTSTIRRSRAREAQRQEPVARDR